MRKTSAWMLATVSSAVLLAGLAAGCAQPTPEERVAGMRGRYSATLQNFIVNEEPLPGYETTDDGMDGAAGEDLAMGEDAGTGDAIDGEAGMEEMAAPVQTNVLLDILIKNDNQQNLPGLTLDVAQVAEGGPEEATWDEIVSSPQHKASWRIWVDTSTIGRGPGNSINHTIENVDAYEAGDRFVVTVREPVPAGERGEYREYAEAS